MKYAQRILASAFTAFCVGAGIVATPGAFAVQEEIDVYIVTDPVQIGEGKTSAEINGATTDDVCIKSDKAGVTIDGPIDLGRTVVADARATVVLPFAPKSISGMTFYELNRVETLDNGDHQVVITPISGLPEANKPYIVLSEESGSSLTFNGGTFVKTPEGKSEFIVTKGDWELVGTFKYIYWNSMNKDIGRIYGFAGVKARKDGRVSAGTFAKISAGSYIYPMRAYLRYTGGAQGVRAAPKNYVVKESEFASLETELPETMDVVIEEKSSEETTSLGTVSTRKAEYVQNDYFDVKGRSLGETKPAVKGSFYNNGKKVMK